MLEALSAQAAATACTSCELSQHLYSLVSRHLDVNIHSFPSLSPAPALCQETVPTKHFYSHNLGKSIMFKCPSQLGKSGTYRGVPFTPPQPRLLGAKARCSDRASAGLPSYVPESLPDRSRASQWWGDTQGVLSQDPGDLANTERKQKTVWRTGMQEWPLPHNHTCDPARKAFLIHLDSLPKEALLAFCYCY